MEKIEDSVQCSRGSLGGSYEDHENRPRFEPMEDGRIPSKDPPHPLRQVVRRGCHGYCRVTRLGTRALFSQNSDSLQGEVARTRKIRARKFHVNEMLLSPTGRHASRITRRDLHPPRSRGGSRIARGQGAGDWVFGGGFYHQGMMLFFNIVYFKSIALSTLGLKQHYLSLLDSGLI